MLKKAFYAFFSELRSYTYFEKLFIIFVMICSFCITSEYSITKPVSYSVFISHFSASYFPYAWLALLPLNFLVVTLYNKALPKLGCFNTMFASVCITVFINVLGAFILKQSKEFAFFHFIWKDIYVLLMFQHLWSVVHSTIHKNRAKYLYGIIYGIGGLGSICGSCVPAFFATKVGSEKLLLNSFIIYLFFVVFYKLALKARTTLEGEGGLEPIQLKKDATSGGFSLIYKSKYLKFILCIVVFMQLASTFIDFQFNAYLENLIRNKDLRTAYSARLFGMIHAGNIFLQFFGAFIVMHLLGLKKSHIFIPMLFALNTLGFILFPIFQLITVCFSTIKACDYSIFTIIKEMLYLPLKTEEKFKAKAVIDVFAYRSSKALASFAILFLQWLHISSITQTISWILLVTFSLWLFSVFYLTRKEIPQTLS